MANTSSVGLVSGYQTSAVIRPFMAAKKIAVYITGMRPETQMYVFFNNVNVSSYCRPTAIPSSGNSADDSTWQISGDIGDTIYSDGNGVVSFYFYIPPITFLVGTGTLIVKDATDDTYTTKAEVAYNSLNFPQNSTNQNDTRPVQVDATAVTSQITNNPTPNASFANPFSQCFEITSSIARGNDGIYVSAIDLYFTAKDTSYGLTFEIRNVSNGTPAGSVVALSRVHLTNDDINVSGTTSVVFPGLVFLQAGNQYAITLIPDGNGSNFSVETGIVGSIDNTTNQPIARTWGNGNLFPPTNSTNWTGISNEFLKFQLYYSAFSSNTSSAVLSNQNYEFLTVANSSGTWIPGEKVAMLNTPLTGSVVANSLSYDLTGVSTTFTTTFLPNTFITIQNSNTVIDVIRIVSIANNTSMTLNKQPSFSNSAANIYKTPTGTVVKYNSNRNALTLIESSASNSSFVFTSNSTVIGADSGATASISSINNKDIHRFQPMISYNSPTKTSVGLSGSLISDDYTSPGNSQFVLAGSNFVNGRNAIIASRSNEVLYASNNKSISLSLNLSTEDTNISPVVDLGVPSIVVYGNQINNDVTNENTKFGNASSRYISKTITLASGMDADDMMVYLSAWRPPGTDLKVYAKILNGADPESFDNKDWTLLNCISGNSNYSDAVSQSDFIELQYTFPTIPPANTQVGVVTLSGNTTVTGVNTSFNTLFANGDLIRFVSGGSSQIVKIANVTSSTAMTLTSNASFSGTGVQYQTILTPKTAVKNANTEVVRYYGNGVAYDQYKYFAIKIDFVATETYLAPTVDNLRVIAVS